MQHFQEIVQLVTSTFSSGFLFRAPNKFKRKSQNQRSTSTIHPFVCCVPKQLQNTKYKA